MTYGHVTEFTAHLRELGYTGVIIAGGEQASLYADDVLTRIPGMDACVKGEGEFVSLDLLERLDDRNRWSEVASLVWRNENRIVHNCGRRMIPNLDILPFPSRDHLPAILAKGGETVISGSRGCPCKCTR
jgi:anaerobic magnesium-protoporphyrin IX monomethyl ester cyclase